jgi:hypothetical protein
LGYLRGQLLFWGICEWGVESGMLIWWWVSGVCWNDAFFLYISLFLACDIFMWLVLFLLLLLCRRWRWKSLSLFYRILWPHR